MKKGLWLGVFAALCAALIFVGVRFAKETGLLVKYPEPAYLSGDEAELRPVYEQLSKKEQAVYEALLRGISAHDEKYLFRMRFRGMLILKSTAFLKSKRDSFFTLIRHIIPLKKLEKPR